MREFHHVSVLLEECIEGLNIKPDGIYVDGTLGGAGHSSRIAAKLTTGRLVGIDRDPVALDAARKRLQPYLERVDLVHANFSQMDNALDELGIDCVDGILLDLGVSSPQLDDGERGFSYMVDAPLDMRMNRADAQDAHVIVNSWSYEELKRILYEYGEERYAPQIAAAICRRREVSPIETTLELADIIRGAMPASALREKQHPAKRSFQAIRIAVNDELNDLSKVMEAAIPRLNRGGRLAVITFHSLEDRIVKNAMASAAKGCTCPPSFPVCVCGKKPQVKLITRKPIVSGETELERNPRARSAKLRICEKL
ncbi:MAG: 16S rRNA (cytosine(1402)-N(4))-methyltransferase RsmH [Eubacteriales bacterium]|nr:16S rRNA (cytosine(1402)-N(4))-methyltransferase RsmH [Eubacteriales bacterium]